MKIKVKGTKTNYEREILLPLADKLLKAQRGIQMAWDSKTPALGAISEGYESINDELRILQIRRHLVDSGIQCEFDPQATIVLWGHVVTTSLPTVSTKWQINRRGILDNVEVPV